MIIDDYRCVLMIIVYIVPFLMPKIYLKCYKNGGHGNGFLRFAWD